jgi:L-lactate utilization protein LutC
MDKHIQDNFDKGDSDNMSLEMKVNHAISSSRQNKFKAQSEIRRLTAWCNDAIFSTYHTEYEKVGASYSKENLLDNYSEIQNKYASALSFETSDKCDQIVKDYKQKIDGYKERIDVFEKQELEYTELKAKLKAIKEQEKRNNKLDSHKNKLENAAITEGESIVASEGDIARLSEGDIAREVAEKEIYYKQLEELNFKYK